MDEATRELLTGNPRIRIPNRVKALGVTEYLEQHHATIAFR